MITRLEYLATGDVLLHRKVVGLRAHLQVFFLRLYFMTDGAGRFRADAAVIRASLYAHELQQVSERDVASRLQELHRADLIKLYAEGDVGYGKVTDDFWQQSDKKRKVRHPAPALPGPAPGLFDQIEPVASPPSVVRKRPKAGVSVSDPPLTSLLSSSIPENGDEWRASSSDMPRVASRPQRGNPADLRLAEECLAELAHRYPRHDLRACLREARRYVRKLRGEEAEVTVGWFVTHWLRFAAEKKPTLALPAETPAQAEQRSSAAADWSAAQQAQLAALLTGPAPAPGTLDHAIWLEGRKSA